MNKEADLIALEQAVEDRLVTLGEWDNFINIASCLLPEDKIYDPRARSDILRNIITMYLQEPSLLEWTVDNVNKKVISDQELIKGLEGFLTTLDDRRKAHVRNYIILGHRSNKGPNLN